MKGNETGRQIDKSEVSKTSPVRLSRNISASFHLFSDGSYARKNNTNHHTTIRRSNIKTGYVLERKI